MNFYDARENRDPESRERDLMARLPAQIAHARASTTAFARLLADVDADAVASRGALAALPVTRKSELLEMQKAARPFGGFAAVGWGAACRRVFASPGPLYEPEGAHPDYYRLARALFAAGFRAGDLVHNTFSYHFTPAGSMMETAAHAIGCTVFPAGIGQTEQQLAAIADLQPDAYVGTPSFLRILLDKADEFGVKPSFTKAFVSGEAFPPSLRDVFAARGIQAFQAYATADIGLIAYETEAREGLVVDEDVVLEIVRPGTGDPVAPGEVGEVVVTTFNPDYPLVRFGTGDLSALLPGTSPCGRTNLRIKGWMGRADQTTKVKGMFVHPGQIAQVVRRHPEITRARLVVDNPGLNDRMTLMCEAAGGGSEALAAAIAASLRELTKLRGEVAFLPGGALANDGKVIDDVRTYA
ncbi:phenylacetate--CoA ligase family protein [Thauera linaloolentis]|uniref:Phenylacetate--CoA ligase n=1 Tax=Thauera linaloolentis (strain DSM 12138 / JCM 21573 / CCUG 41526 / CIP 105981 / IAM 15112 / NBRC 102519 / 47Lol) TaxID=1123367 RepID=N6ZET6_THAL4|nr:AMP-binding protein [Thauera linaloolentis]ENO90674.1 phenylacetate--CoA ligase [Thauera linaloolentis 47Lol = DSM 12138]MCM8565582.1 AMP-binding protein [Thauera linaloolentis]